MMPVAAFTVTLVASDVNVVLPLCAAQSHVIKIGRSASMGPPASNFTVLTVNLLSWLRVNTARIRRSSKKIRAPVTPVIYRSNDSDHRGSEVSSKVGLRRQIRVLPHLEAPGAAKSAPTELGSPRAGPLGTGPRAPSTCRPLDPRNMHSGSPPFFRGARPALSGGV